MSLENAKAASKAENKPIYIHGYTDGCSYCKYMIDSVYTDKDVAEFYNANFISLKLNMEKEGKALNDALKIHNYPCMIFYDTNGEIMHRAAGRKYKLPFLELGKDALNPQKQMRSFQKKYSAGTASPGEVQLYFRMQETSGMDAQAMINDYLMKQPDSLFSSSNNWRILNDIFRSPTLPVMNRFLDAKKEFEVKYTSDSVNSKIISLYNSHLMRYVQQLDSVGYEREKQKILSNKKIDISEKVCAWADLNKYKMKSDWASYKIAGKAFVEKYAMDDYRRLNDVATVYYERFYTDKEALALTELWLKQSISIKDVYKSNNLLASVSVMLGKKQQALDAANHAMELAIRDNVDSTPTKQLFPVIEKMP
jgi:thiol-disulfide isomerase/thioredoxin